MSDRLRCVHRADGGEYRPRRDASTIEELPPPEPVDRQRAEATRLEAKELAGLIAAVAQGDRHAFAELYERTCDRVHGLMLRVLKAAEPAAEVTREAFLEVWRQAPRYHEDQGTVFSWIVAIAHQLAVERVRAEGGPVLPHRIHSHELTEGIEAVWGVIEQALGSRRVKVGLGALTWVERQALLLAYFESFSPEQVAVLLDLDEQSVTVSMRDGLRNLRRALGVGDHD